MYRRQSVKKNSAEEATKSLLTRRWACRLHRCEKEHCRRKDSNTLFLMSIIICGSDENSFISALKKNMQRCPRRDGRGRQRFLHSFFVSTTGCVEAVASYFERLRERPPSFQKTKSQRPQITSSQQQGVFLHGWKPKMVSSRTLKNHATMSTKGWGRQRFPHSCFVPTTEGVEAFTLSQED